MFFGSSAAANENPPDWIPKVVTLLPLSPSASRHFGKVCASLDTWTGKTFLLSGDLRRVKLIGYVALRLNWSVST